LPSETEKKYINLRQNSDTCLQKLKKYINLRQNSDTCLQRLKKIYKFEAKFGHLPSETEKKTVPGTIPTFAWRN